jgi:hypothetical protein
LFFFFFLKKLGFFVWCQEVQRLTEENMEMRNNLIETTERFKKWTKAAAQKWQRVSEQVNEHDGSLKGSKKKEDEEGRFRFVNPKCAETNEAVAALRSSNPQVVKQQSSSGIGPLPVAPQVAVKVFFFFFFCVFLAFDSFDD